jgi:hypothetical protein
MAARPPPRRLSLCEICSKIPTACRADMTRDTGNMPGEFRRLVGLPDDFGSSTRREVHCPICGTRYGFEIETGCLEWDIGLWRCSPRASRETWGEARYAAVVAALPLDIESDVTIARDYAARSLAEHYLATRNARALKRLLRHRRADVRKAAWSTCGCFTLGPDCDAHEETALALLRARDGDLRDRALRCWTRSHSYLEKRGAAIAAKLGARSLDAAALKVLGEIVKRDASVDLGPARLALIRYAARRGLPASARRAAVETLKESARGRPAAIKAILADLEGAGRAGRHRVLRRLAKWLGSRHAAKTRAQAREDRAYRTREDWPPR